VRRLRWAFGLAALLGVVLALLWGWQVYQHRQEREEGLILFRAGRFPEALPQLRHAWERSPEDVEILQALAQVYLSGEDPAAAEPLLIHWAELRPEDAEPRKRLLQLYRQQQKYESALAAAREVLQREPDNPTVQRRLAELCISTGHFDEAEQALGPCLQRQPRDRGLRLLLAEVKRGRGQTEQAEAILEQLLQEQPRYPAALMLAGILYRETGRPEKAIPLLEQVLLQDPRRARPARYQLSMALEQAGRHDEAQRMGVELRRLQDIQVLQELLPSRPDDLDLRVRLAEMLFQEGESAEGRRLLEEVRKRDPQFEAAKKVRARYLPLTPNPSPPSTRERGVDP
jgi:predicted Zn-dependent protease